MELALKVASKIRRRAIRSVRRDAQWPKGTPAPPPPRRSSSGRASQPDHGDDVQGHHRGARGAQRRAPAAVP
jgi:hypothetical protein